MIKKIIFRASLLLFLLFCVGGFFCGDEQEAIFEQPLLITSVGQSAEVQLASILAKRAGLTYTLEKTATQKDLENVKTLCLVFGASLKGLGAAGLDIAKERERVEMLVKQAAKKNISLLCMHLGGESRRGQLTDALIKDFLPLGKMAIIVKSGNNDGMFSTICKEYNIPLVEVEKAIQALDPLKRVFK